MPTDDAGRVPVSPVLHALRFRDTGELVGFAVSSNDGGDFCVDVAVSLCRPFGNAWTVTDRAVAERVAGSSSEWYGAGYESPINPFVGELEVVGLRVA